MSFSFSLIRKSIYEWVSKRTNLTTIWFNANAPRPKRPYIALNIMNFASKGFDYQTPPDDEGMASLYGDREFTLEINYYGEEGYDVFEDLRTSLREFDVKEELLASGVIFFNRTQITDITTLLDTRYEPRLLMEIMFRVSNQGITDPHKFNVGIISRVEGELDIKDVTGESKIHDDFQVEDDT